MQHSYESFQAVDFVCDDAFLKHHLSPDAQSVRFWEQWLQAHPHRQDAWRDAQQLLEAVRLGLSEYARTYLSEEAEARLLARIQTTNALAEAEPQVVPLWRTTAFGRAVAACLVIGLGVGVWLFTTRPEQQSVYRQQVASLSQPAVEQINQTQFVKPVPLPDGSTALLFPQSRLSYPTDFGRKKRTIYLLGKANFDVTKDAEKPFYVYANRVVTRVLGTRFTVEAFDSGQDVVVTVQHGQVNVYQDQPLNQHNTSGRTLEGILVQPNQQVVFSRRNEQFTKKIVDKPAILQSDSLKNSAFVFDESPVAEAFELIKKVYGINIIYSAYDLAGCQLTASLTEESLFEKLDVITKSLGATYQVVDGEIIITAKGCKTD